VGEPSSRKRNGQRSATVSCSTNFAPAAAWTPGIPWHIAGTVKPLKLLNQPYVWLRTCLRWLMAGNFRIFTNVRAHAREQGITFVHAEGNPPRSSYCSGGRIHAQLVSRSYRRWAAPHTSPSPSDKSQHVIGSHGKRAPSAATPHGLELQWHPTRLASKHVRTAEHGTFATVGFAGCNATGIWHTNAILNRAWKDLEPDQLASMTVGLHNNSSCRLQQSSKTPRRPRKDDGVQGD
jgi:hypothetical protein